MSKGSSFNLLALLILVGTCCGCGPDTPPLGEVHGVVTNNGTPVAGASVRFIPEKGRPSTATTDEDGGFELRYTPEASGALLGEHRVLITPGAKAYGTGAVPGEPLSIPPPPEPVELAETVTVKPGKNEFQFDLAEAAKPTSRL